MRIGVKETGQGPEKRTIASAMVHPAAWRGAWRAQKVALLVGGPACLAQTVKFVKDSYELRMNLSHYEN